MHDDPERVIYDRDPSDPQDTDDERGRLRAADQIEFELKRVVDAWNAASPRKVGLLDQGVLRTQMGQVIRGVVVMHIDPETSRAVNDSLLAMGGPLARLRFMVDQTLAFIASDRAKQGYVPALGRWVTGRHGGGDGTPGWLADPSAWQDHEVRPLGGTETGYSGGISRDEALRRSREENE